MRWCLFLVILFLFCGCGGGGGDNGPTPIRMRGELRFNSNVVKHAKVALVTLDVNDNWVTESSSKEISSNSDGWGSYSLNLPIINRNSVYAIIAYDDRNHNGKFDEINNELLSTDYEFYAEYYAYDKRWEVTDYQGNVYGRLPAYWVRMDTTYYASATKSEKLGSIDLKQNFRTIRLKFEGR